LKSEKLKRFENFVKIGDDLKQVIKIKDFERIQNHYDKLEAELKKAAK